MSNQVAILDHLTKLEPKFAKQNQFNLKFESECLFARQQLMKNDYTLQTAANNPQSLRNAILNVAAIGISLNPASAHAYLVPRDGSICLDISWKGLVKLATDSGAIEWAKAELVYNNDEFAYNGPATPPTHSTDPFDPDHTFDTIKGAYCIAKLASGDFMIETMSAAEIMKIKNTSKASNGPWQTWPEQMAKKSIVKRASKSWPQSNGRERIDQAIDILNAHEGLVETVPSSVNSYLKHSPEQAQEYHRRLEWGDPLRFFVWWNPLNDLVKTSLINSFTEAKGKGRELTNRLDADGRVLFLDLLADLTSACESEDDVGAREVLESLDSESRSALVGAVKLDCARFAISVNDGINEPELVE